MSDLDLDLVLDVYGPQLGEMIWHSLHLDPTLTDMSSRHASRIAGLAQKHGLGGGDKPVRILEIGAYAHFGVQMACAMISPQAQGWVHDVSPMSLRIGAAEAAKLNLPAATLIAGDFHDLPFSANFFDIVFVASSIHHTFRPWKVLGEMLRVTRPGGIVHLENEPVGRQFCFYQYRGNRAEGRGDFEQAVERSGLTWTVNSPFPGSRPETVFGMIENDRIPLSVYVDTLSQGGRIETLELIPQVAEFERRVLDLPRDSELAAKIQHELHSKFAGIKKHVKETDRILGYDLPSKDQTWLLCYHMAERLRALDKLTGEAHQRGLADLFGAAMRATVVKSGGKSSKSPPKLSRNLQTLDKVLMDLPQLDAVKLEFSAALLPEIRGDAKAKLEAVYSPQQWILYEEANGLHSMLNVYDTARISLPKTNSPSLILARYYAVERPSGAPYLLQFADPEGQVLSEHVICQSESLLSRFIVPRGCSSVSMQLRNSDGTPALDLHAAIHLSVARLIPISGRGVQAAA